MEKQKKRYMGKEKEKVMIMGKYSKLSMKDLKYLYSHVSGKSHKSRLKAAINRKKKSGKRFKGYKKK